MAILTEDELLTVKLISEGKFNKEIAYELNRSVSTVKSRIRIIFFKTRSRNRVELTLKFLRGELQCGS